jgi:dihydrofolate synthase/folylpolyglutamate synthase
MRSGISWRRRRAKPKTRSGPWYRQIEQLNAMTPELYTGAGHPRRKFSLDEVGTLLAALGEPQRSVRSVLIAGTNGKGSTASTLASILTASGLRVGLYTSPHLARVNERIRIGEAEIADEEFASLFFRVSRPLDSWCWMVVCRSILVFLRFLPRLRCLLCRRPQVDLAVLEVGMGGRLDATNIVDPLVSVITDISLDHTEWLGSTIYAIAREKAGILRAGGTMIRLAQEPEANRALDEAAARLDVRCADGAAYLPSAGADDSGSYDVEALGDVVEVASPLIGAHQQRNVALAIATAVELATSHGFPITPAAIAQGIRQTRWPGRLECIKTDGVEWILDVAHNPAGAWALRAGLHGLGGKTLIFSCLRDKPVAEMAQILFPLFEQVIFAPIHSPRAVAMESLRPRQRLPGAGPQRRVRSRGAAISQGAQPGRGGGRLRVGLPGGRGAFAAAGRRTRRMRVRPNPLPRIYRWRTNLLHVPLMTLITVVCGSLSMLVSLVDKKGNVQHNIARVWARGCVWACGSRLTLVGAENLRKHPAAVYASNHTSYMDTPVIFAALPFQFRIWRGRYYGLSHS